MDQPTPIQVHHSTCQKKNASCTRHRLNPWQGIYGWSSLHHSLKVEGIHFKTEEQNLDMWALSYYAKQSLQIDCTEEVIFLTNSSQWIELLLCYNLKSIEATLINSFLFRTWSFWYRWFLYFSTVRWLLRISWPISKQLNPSHVDASTANSVSEIASGFIVEGRFFLFLRRFITNKFRFLRLVICWCSNPCWHQ